MPGQRVPAPAGQQPEPVVEPREQLPGRQRPQPPRRQLDGEGNPVEPPAQLPYARLVPEDHALLRGPVGEQFQRLVLAERRHRDDPLTRQLQRPPPHREHPQPRHPPEQLGHQLGAYLHQVLEPVEHQEELTLRQMPEQRLTRQPRGVVRQPQRLHDREVHEFRVAHRRQLHPPDAVRGADRVAARAASRDLPTPPGPVTVTRREASSARANSVSSAERPTNRSVSRGRLPSAVASPPWEARMEHGAY